MQLVKNEVISIKKNTHICLHLPMQKKKKLTSKLPQYTVLKRAEFYRKFLKTYIIFVPQKLKL